MFFATPSFELYRLSQVEEGSALCRISSFLRRRDVFACGFKGGGFVLLRMLQNTTLLGVESVCPVTEGVALSFVVIFGRERSQQERPSVAAPSHPNEHSLRFFIADAMLD